jgi:uncharacterized membrane protein YuzA (DUF378 family)
MFFKIIITLGAICAMGFFTYNFVRLLMGRRTF